MSQGEKQKDNTAASKEELDWEETRNEEETDSTRTECINKEMKEAERILDKEVQEIQERHLYMPNIHWNDSSYEKYDSKMKATQAI